MKALRQRLLDAAHGMERQLRVLTGLSKLMRKVVVYYTLATHALRTLEVFPLLVLIGPTGTGKTQTQKVIANFACQPNAFSLRGLTLPVIRDELAVAHEGTAVIEEADQAWKDNVLFEGLLSDRYHRGSAKAGLKEAQGDSWVTVHKACFGATVLHRRIPFADPALDGRCVSIRFRPVLGREYDEFEETDTELGKKLTTHLEVNLPDVACPRVVAPRIFDSYRPLVRMAQLCGDDGFLKEITNILLMKTAELREAQSVEPDVLVLRAIVENLHVSGKEFNIKNFRNIRFGNLADSIWKNHRRALDPHQVGAIARSLGFKTKISHGLSVVIPTPAKLVSACHECAYEDDAVVLIRDKILKKST